MDQNVQHFGSRQEQNQKILKDVKILLNIENIWRDLFGDEKAEKRIVGILVKK